MIPLRDSHPSLRPPGLTYTLIILNVLVFFLELSLGPQLRKFILAYGFVPRRFLVSVGEGEWLAALIPVFTSMFLHGGWLHLIGNVWTLYIFGDNVEDTLGHGLFLAFYFFCGVAACLAQFLTGPNSTIPMVGASGAIAGIMGAYFALFPWARVLTLLPLFPFFPIIEIPAYIFLGFWFLLQFFSGTLSILGPGIKGGVAFFAHVGGFAVGYLVMRVLFPHLTGAPSRRQKI